MESQWIVTRQEYERLTDWELNGMPEVKHPTERTQLALIITNTYIDGLFTFDEVQHRLDRLFGRTSK